MIKPLQDARAAGGTGSGNGLKRMFVFAAAVSAVLFAVRFVKLFSYPVEYINDEMFDIYGAVLKNFHIQGFFAMDSLTGAGGTLMSQLCSFFVPIVREKIELYRIMPVLLNALYIYGIFLVSAGLFGAETGITAVFISSVSFWNFFNSRIVLSNTLIPVLGVFTVYFLMKSYNSKKLYIIPALFLFVAGCNTYVTHFLILPVLLYIIHEYGKESGNRGGNGRTAFIFLVTGLAAAGFYLLTTDVLTRVFSVMNVTPGSPPLNILENISNIRLLFIPSRAYPEHFPVQLPVMNPVEFILLGLGVVILLKTFNKKESRILIVMFLAFIIPLFVSREAHQLRVVQAQTPVFIISACAVNFLRLRARKIFIVLLAVSMAALYLFSARIYFREFEKQRQIDLINRDIALYLNGTCGAGVKYLEYFDFDEKERTVCRLKSTYDKKTHRSRIAVKLEGFWLEQVKEFLPAEKSADLKLFFSNLNNEEKRYPALLVVLPAGSIAGKRMELYSEKLMKIREYKKNHKPEDLAVFAASWFSESTADALFNTVLKRIIAETFIERGDFAGAAREYTSAGHPSYTPPDFCLKAAKCFYAAGDNGKARFYYSKYMEGKKALEPYAAVDGRSF
jgi:hypothetical protein